MNCRIAAFVSHGAGRDRTAPLQITARRALGSIKTIPGL